MTEEDGMDIHEMASDAVEDALMDAFYDEQEHFENLYFRRERWSEIVKARRNVHAFPDLMKRYTR